MIRTESQDLEFKASFGEWKEAIQALCAFANAKGGRVLVGVDDEGNTTGLQLGRTAIEDFLNKVRQHTDPILYPSVTVRTFGIDSYVEIFVEEADTKPVFAFDRPYVRVGKTTQKLSATALREMVLRHGPGRFDENTVQLSRHEFQVSHPPGRSSRCARPHGQRRLLEARTSLGGPLSEPLRAQHAVRPGEHPGRTLQG